MVVILGLAAWLGCVPRPDPIPTGPWISLSTSEVAFRRAVGFGNGGSASTVTIRNAGTEPFGIPEISVEYVEAPGDWLQHGLTAEGRAHQLDLWPRDPEGGPLAPGVYHAKVEVAASGAENSPVFVDVVLEVVVATPEGVGPGAVPEQPTAGD